MKKLLLFILAVSLLVEIGSAQSKKKETTLEKLDKYYEKAVLDWGIPGMTVGIVKDGKLIFSKGYGVKEVGKTDKPDGNTLYAIASNSKAFTSAIIGQLVDEGKLKWDDKVQKYIPWFELYDPMVSHETTIRDILSHRVGLGTFSGDVIWYKSGLNAEEIVRRAKYLPKAFDFRSGYGYSNIMYITAGEIIRAVTGKTWLENVQERLLKPLEMNRTIASPKILASVGNYATPHALDEGKNIPIPWTDWEIIAAMGGLISSTNDVANWMIFNMNNGIWKNDTLLSKASRNMILTPHNNFRVDHTTKNDFDRHFNGYGLGWGLSDYKSKMMVGHTGGYDGMLTAVTMIPGENLGVVVLTNGMKSPMMAITYYTFDAFLGKQNKDWSADLLAATNKREAADTRITDRKASQVPNTQPSLALEKYAGTYFSDIYGNIFITVKNGLLHLEFEHSPELSATLKHFHFDVWEIQWDLEQAWFKFGTVKFNTNNYLKVTGMDFDVPNDDIFFDELKPRKVSEKKL